MAESRRDSLVISLGSTTARVSPMTRRGRLSGAIGVSPMVLDKVNNDDVERRQRFRHRMSDAVQRQLPATPADSNRSKGAAAGVIGWSSNQVTEHLNNCIQLFQDNKINTKNAFNLHLIDTMRDLLSKDQQTNFQMAGSTLEAGAKIYATRVDALHLQAIQVHDQVSQIDKGKEGAGHQATQEGSEPDDDMETQQQTQRRQRKKKKIIVTDLKKINLTAFDSMHEIDPLIQKISKEGDSSFGGLLLNSLRCRDDMCSLLLDMTSSTKPDPDWTPNTDRQLEPAMFGSIPDISDQLICPTFNDFKPDTQDKHPIWEVLNSKEEHRYDPDKEISFHNENPPGDDYPGGDDDDFGSPNAPNADDEVVDYVGVTSKSNLQTIISTTDGTLSSLMSMVTADGGEYSYFGNIKNMWAGPSHWKAQLRIQPGKRPIADVEGEPSRKRVAGKTKKLFLIDFDVEVDFEKHFKKTKAATTVTNATLEGYNQLCLTLPEDLHYESKKLLTLFTRSIVLKRVQSSGSEESESNDDDKVEDDYDYANKTDQTNFCADLSVVSGPEADNPSETLAFDETLLSQPRLVEKININFAKRPKKIDFKRLKRNMWNLITTPDKNKENEERQADPEKPFSIRDKSSFNCMFTELRLLCPSHESRDLSKAIGFVALLHMCNEKNLALEATEKFEDLLISAGDP